MCVCSRCSKKLNERFKTKSQLHSAASDSPRYPLFAGITRGFLNKITVFQHHTCCTSTRRRMGDSAYTHQRMFARHAEGMCNWDIKKEEDEESGKKAGIARGIFFLLLLCTCSTMHDHVPTTTSTSTSNITAYTTVVLLAK